MAWDRVLEASLETTLSLKLKSRRPPDRSRESLMFDLDLSAVAGESKLSEVAGDDAQRQSGV